MLLLLVGLCSSGRNTIATYLTRNCNFTRLEVADLQQEGLSFPSAEALLDHATLNWRSLYVTVSRLSKEELDAFRKRPWCLIVYIEAPMMFRYRLRVER